MKNLVVANWKMHFDVKESVETVLEIAKITKPYQEKVEIAVCPSYLAIPEVKNALASTKIKIGAQNCSWEQEGALTGEVSPKVLKDYCEYIILGHSERRMHLNETDEVIAKKIDLVTDLNIKPIVCIGETLEEHDRGDLTKLLYEVKKAFSLVPKNQAEDVIIAYEPIWAISTSQNHSNEKVTCDYSGGVAKKIKEEIAKIYNPTISEKVRIIYGGSVTPKNIEHLHCQPEITGYLVGGASLEPEKFKEIIESIA